MARRRKRDHKAAIGAALALVGGGAVMAALLVPRRAGAAALPASSPVLDLDGIKVYRSGNLLWWLDGDLSIDFDGAPNAYAPSGVGKPLDKLANAGHPGEWWGLLTDNGKKDGEPLVQKDGEPYPGYYISTTALSWPGEQRAAKYVDSTRISYIALPPVFRTLGARLGDIALVESTKTARRHFAIWADVGPRTKLGEGSWQLAKALGVESSALRKSGINVSIILGSGDGQPHTDEEIQRRGAALLKLLA